MSEAQQQEKPADAWGQPTSEERQRELAAVLAAWDAPGTDRGERKGPFWDVQLTGAEVGWLAERSGRDVLGSRVPNLHLETLYVNRGLLCYESRTEGGHLEVPGQRSAEDMFL
jgi:hypothetical protein